MRTSGWLARLGGAQEDILARAPGDRARFTSMGGVLIGTAVMAAASAAFALNSAAKIDGVSATLVGLVWGAIILNLDRMLVVSMKRQNGWRLNLAAALPRVLLAALLGAVISMPLVLKLFEKEITSELQIMQNEAISQAQTGIDDNTRFKRIPDLQKQIAALIPVTEGDSAKDPEVARLAGLLGAKQQEFADANAALQCELDGRANCGTGRPGDGPRAADKRTVVDALAKEVADLQSQYDAAVGTAKGKIAAGQDPAVETAKAELARAQSDLKVIQEEKSTAEQALASAKRNDTGLSAQLEALARLGAKNPTLAVAHWAVGLLFAAIEILPVFSKLLTEIGPKTLYERLEERREEDAIGSLDEVTDHDRRISEIRADTQVRLERERADAQVEAGRRANARLVDRQEEITGNAIDTWARVASAQSDAELAQWYKGYSAAPARNGTAPPAPVPEQATPWDVYTSRSNNGPNPPTGPIP